MAFFDSSSEFFDLLERQSDAARRAAAEFATVGEDFSRARAVMDRLDKIEAEADQMTHDLVARADAKFITPFDKEDLHRLSVLLDDLTDYVEAAAARIVIYHLDKPRPDFPQLLKLIGRSMEATHQAVTELRNLKNHAGMQNALIQVHSIEAESDVYYREALDRLFGEVPADALHILKWKDIYDRIELTIDRCEDVADMLETMAVKYA